MWRRYHYTKGSDLKVRKNHLHSYIPSPFEDRRLVWGDSIYRSAVACSQSCSIQTDLHLYHRRHHSLWWNMYPHKLQHGFFFNILVTNWSAECPVSYDFRTRDLRFQRVWPERVISITIWFQSELILFKIFGGRGSFLWGRWYPCFGLMVTSPLGFKSKLGSLIRTWHRRTC